jgi:peptidoglycan L-alanyl-D-glutamate endopeptidase CwlK
MLFYEKRLEGVNQKLQQIVRSAAALCDFDVIVVEGLRSRERQQQLYDQGRKTPGKIVTWTLNSKHIDGVAVDLAPLKSDGSIDWENLKAFDTLAAAMGQAATMAGTSIRWGADWDGDGKPRERGESDSPHFELA